MARSDIPVVLGEFAGYNSVVDPRNLADQELDICRNLDIGLAGELTVRPPWHRQHDIVTAAHAASTHTKIIGHYKTATLNLLMVVVNNELFTYDGSTSTLLSNAYSNIEYGVQYAGVFYMCRSNGEILSYDGTTLSAITGSPFGTMMLVHKDRLFIFNTSSTTLYSRIYFSAIGDFTSWPSTNFIDVNAGDGDWLVGAVVYADVLMLFKSRSIWGLYAKGDVANWSLRNFSTELGCTSKYALIQVDSSLYFVSHRGVYKTDTTTYTEISLPIADAFTLKNVTQSTLNKDHLVKIDNRILCLSNKSGSVGYYVFYYKKNAWSFWDHSSNFEPAYFIEITDGDAFTSGVWAGNTGLSSGYQGYLSRLVNNSTTPYDINLSSSLYQWWLRTKAFDFDAPHISKRLKWMALELWLQAYSTGFNENITVTYYVNGDDQAPITINISELTDASFESSNLAFKVPGCGYFRILQVDVKGTTNNRYTLTNLTLLLAPKSKIIPANA